MKNWTPETLSLLKYYAEHRDYLVRCRSMGGRGSHGIVTTVTLDHGGWFGVDFGEDMHEIKDYNPEDFDVLGPLKEWCDLAFECKQRGTDAS